MTLAKEVFKKNIDSIHWLLLFSILREGINKFRKTCSVSRQNLEKIFPPRCYGFKHEILLLPLL